MKLAREGYTVTLTDLTPRLVEIAESNAQELNISGQFRGFYKADARDLSMIHDEQFDASIMLGPMYHLQEENDRILAVKSYIE